MNWLKENWFKILLLFVLLLPLISDAAVRVRGYYRKDGTYVSPHYRSNPDGNPYNNWSYPGNTNPYTGETATGDPNTYLRNYYNKSHSSSYSSSIGNSGGNSLSSVTVTSLVKRQQLIDQLAAQIAALQAQLSLLRLVPSAPPALQGISCYGRLYTCPVGAYLVCSVVKPYCQWSGY